MVIIAARTIVASYLPQLAVIAGDHCTPDEGGGALWSQVRKGYSYPVSHIHHPPTRHPRMLPTCPPPPHPPTLYSPTPSLPSLTLSCDFAFIHPRENGPLPPPAHVAESKTVHVPPTLSSHVTHRLASAYSSHFRRLRLLLALLIFGPARFWAMLTFGHARFWPRSLLAILMTWSLDRTW